MKISEISLGAFVCLLMVFIVDAPGEKADLITTLVNSIIHFLSYNNNIFVCVWGGTTRNTYSGFLRFFSNNYITNYAVRDHL